MSILRVNTIQNTSGTEQYLARAWVNFNGTGVVAIRAAGNVSSITDNGGGTYRINFTIAMTDANYSVSGTCSNADLTNEGYITVPTPTSSSFVDIFTRRSNAITDSNAYLVIFR